MEHFKNVSCRSIFGIYNIENRKNNVIARASAQLKIAETFSRQRAFRRSAVYQPQREQDVNTSHRKHRTNNGIINLCQKYYF